MKFLRTPIDGVAILELEERGDQRGFFARSFCRDEFEANGLLPDVVQCNISYNHVAGTLRGMHFQLEPATEAKLVRCIAGSIVDVIVDLRPDSTTFRQHVSVELSAANRRSLYVPPMFAHGYQTLVDDTEVLYQVSERYTPGMERGLRYDDPTLGLSWPLPVTLISEKDANWPLLELAGVPA
ncbi:MAG TPA: dTDP-4-dehydrorhamnose 3,5-epimerase [Nakamurella sp.]